ncbi:MAG TPA: ATP-binding protein [Terriglobales bacterium]|nr:ATP-binding protein [Terriglobales bacterium]
MALNLLRMDIRYEHDVVLARQRARQVAAALKFDTQDQTRIATAVSEIARNAFQYGGGGLVEFQIDKDAEPRLTVSVIDKGKGIGNLREILDGKYVSKTGMGLGLLGAKRLMDFFHVETAPGKGATITLGKLLPNRHPSFAKKDLDSLLSKLETRAPHNPYEELQQQNKELLNTLEELRARQAELAQLNQELDETNRGVVALYAELDDKADFLQRASELKSHFLSNMSHEFRTPLNSILALGQILIDRLDGDLSAEQEKQVRFMRNSAQNLLDLVNDLLDLAKVEAGKVTIRPSNFSVNTLFAALRGMLRPLLVQNSSVKLVFDDPEEDIQIYSDEAKVSQILRNFISNALKFTERGEVRVSVDQEGGNTLRFSVTDTGIGIAEDDQERIFQEWTQLEGKLQKAAKGSGLGLPLSRKLAQLLGGNVHVKSRLGLGSTFTAVIPMTFKGETDVVYVPEVKRELDADRVPVLVVEDNREALFIYEKYLKGSRFQVVPARNIVEAKASLKAFRPVAIVLDVLLEGEHSWDLLRDLKQDSATHDIPIYVVTVVDNRQKALALGADGFQAKPIDRIWLLDQLNMIASGKVHPRVLIIDDDETSRYLVRTVLANTGCEMREAEGGIEGVRLAKEYEPDIVILDLAMPDLNGFEVLRELNRDPHTSSSHVIVHTSKTLGEQDYSRFGQALEVIPKDVMKSRDKAIAQFTEAFRKAGVNLSLLAKDHSMAVNHV